MQKRSFTSLLFSVLAAALIVLTTGCAEMKHLPQQISAAVSNWSLGNQTGVAQAESKRVEAEYQKAFDTTGDFKGGLRYAIETKMDNTPVFITLTIYPYEIIPPSGMCRNFFEEVRVGATIQPREARRACRTNGLPWKFTAR